jgi:hypothetical protein
VNEVFFTHVFGDMPTIKRAGNPFLKEFFNFNKKNFKIFLRRKAGTTERRNVGMREQQNLDTTSALFKNLVPPDDIIKRSEKLG